MIVDTKTNEVLYDGEEWIWVRRSELHSAEEIGGDGRIYCVAWLIQRKNLSRNSNVRCTKRLTMCNEIQEGKYDVCTGRDIIECSEYEAFNYWKPQINYEIY